MVIRKKSHCPDKRPTRLIDFSLLKCAIIGNTSFPYSGTLLPCTRLKTKTWDISLAKPFQLFMSFRFFSKMTDNQHQAIIPEAAVICIQVRQQAKQQKVASQKLGKGQHEKLTNYYGKVYGVSVIIIAIKSFPIFLCRIIFISYTHSELIKRADCMF